MRPHPGHAAHDRTRLCRAARIPPPRWKADRRVDRAKRRGAIDLEGCGEERRMRTWRQTDLRKLVPVFLNYSPGGRRRNEYHSAAGSERTPGSARDRPTDESFRKCSVRDHFRTYNLATEAVRFLYSNR